ncbi:uncharacterized protein A1O9_06348 [Exophiala aquamarina CBS 119918]|uniref:Amine oxidase domain-containing protein n=1 Tax=Exophiala aquamarina CBS 119918 TaxID=1182545 RepID=A0A072PF85_9EURO|nr:uncharacterized protein A1O9_06348 [Exophiala aquamarina CBS 119918]KEF58422.1 hypothetical protein A1O9_06348 [Exophiala aquamarina CBS 119918]
MSPPHIIPHVAVIGAGMAGLRCSTVLARSGFKVTILEARNRIGGRVHQQSSGGHLVDMGPNWIHGTKGNPILTLAEKTHTAVLEPEEDSALFGSDGLRRPEAEAKALSAKIWGLIADAFKYSDENWLDPQMSLFDYIKARLDEDDKLETRNRVNRLKLDRRDLLRHAEMWGPFIGDPIQTQSMRFFWLEQCIEGENVIVAGTYRNILAEVARLALEHEQRDNVDLRLDTEAVHFELARDGTDRNDEDKVTVTTAAGDKLSFNDIVLTAPLGWLKRNKDSAFTPALPSGLSQAIDNINYGRLEKLYVTFPSAFWLGEGGRDTSRHPIFTQFHSPNYVEHPEGASWNQEIVSLAHLPGPNAHPTLLFYIYGPCATWVVEQVTNLTPHSDTYNAVLAKFAEPFYSRLPNYSPSTNAACIPKSFLMTQWQNDKFAGNGSYCNFQVDLEHGDKDILAMRWSCGMGAEKGLWLAGEHTAPFIALGTTTGAYWSGEGVATDICERYGIAKAEDSCEVEQQGQKKDVTSAKENGDAANLNGLAL